MINPHFDLPFRFMASGSVAQAEQNTFEDIANCVEAIVRTPLGYRDDASDFGFPDLTLLEQPILTKDIIELLQGQEPRVVILMEENYDQLDVLIDRLTVSIGTG